MNSEFLSICIPTCNRARYLREILRSFADQVGKDRISGDEVAFYVSDNASTDETPEVFRQFERQVPRAVYSRNGSNLGIAGNIVQVCTLAQGRYWWLVGDDELIHDKAVANILSLLRKENPGLLLAFNSRYDLRLSVPHVFPDYQAFARECIRRNPHALAEHTLLSSNVFRSDCYDHSFAKEHASSYMPHMYGVMRPLIKKRAAVALPDFPIIAVREPTPDSSPADGLWLDLDRVWVEYLEWLSREMAMPELDAQAPSNIARRQLVKKMMRHPLSFVRGHRKALLQPTAYLFVLRRIFRLRREG